MSNSLHFTNDVAGEIAGEYEYSGQNQNLRQMFPGKQKKPRRKNIHLGFRIWRNEICKSLKERVFFLIWGKLRKEKKRKELQTLKR